MTDFDQSTYLEMLRLEDKYARPPSVWEVIKAFPDCRAIAARHAYNDIENYRETMDMAGQDIVLQEFVKISPLSTRLQFLRSFLHNTRTDIQHEKLDIDGAKQVPIQSLYDFSRFKPTSTRIHVICPFHNEKAPSMVIYLKNNTFHCFGCQKGGSAIDFVMHLHGKSFKEAVKYINSHQ